MVKNNKQKYITVSLPRGIGQEIDSLIEKLEFWPSRGAFVREACLEKINIENERLKRRT
jgi:metal-responsive CopG/Arc/MetJ family transcriptional regulator